MDKVTIQKVKSLLKRGDQAEIARQTGTHKVTVARFFSGEDFSDETTDVIISAAAKIINDREKRKAKSVKAVLSLINKSR